MLRALLGDVEISLGDAKSSLGDVYHRPIEPTTAYEGGGTYGGGVADTGRVGAARRSYTSYVDTARHPTTSPDHESRVEPPAAPGVRFGRNAAEAAGPSAHRMASLADLDSPPSPTRQLGASLIVHRMVHRCVVHKA
jgi:hypothetical protein